jgi:hypothetical protein
LLFNSFLMGVREVNKKVLLIAVALMAVAMLATPLVSAKPSAAKNNDKFLSFVWHSENGASTPTESKTNPPWAEAGDIIVSHGEAVWTLNPSGNNYVQIGDDPPIPIDAVTGYEGILYVQTVAKSPTFVALNYRVYEKIMWGDNYIEIMCLERASYDLSGPFPVFYASGTFNGHGEIDGQKVQVMGIREGSFQAVGFVLECTGTIQFLGNAP